MCTEATKGEVVIRVSGDVEGIRVFEDPLISVRRGIPHAHVLAGLDGRSAQFKVSYGRPRKLHHR